MSESLYPWWVTSNPDHPVNASLPVPEAPLMSESEADPDPEPEVVAEPDVPDLTDLSSHDPFPVPPHIAEAVEQAPYLPPDIIDAARIADSPDASLEDRKVAVDKLIAWGGQKMEAYHSKPPVADAHPSTIPDDLIPAEYQVKASE